MNCKLHRRHLLRWTAITTLGTALLADAGQALAADAAPAAAPMRDISSAQLAREMVPGINIGNTLEALPTETSWGNPPVNAALLKAYKAAGFNSVRLPVAWLVHADASDQVQAAWMARVRQVIDDALAAGLVVMVNTHWDTGWLNHTTTPHQAALNRRLAKLWTQIATALRDYDERVLFAGTNEVTEENVWTEPTPENAAVQNSFNQTFVSTVRATGGNNAKRHLVVQGYNTNIGHTLKYAVLPKDTVADRLMVEVHYYDPYDFTLDEKSKVWQWGAIAKDAAATHAGNDEPWVESEFGAMQERYVRHGIPVIVGEYGAYPKPDQPGMKPYLGHWVRTVTASIHRHGLVPMWWDTGALFDRHSGAQKDPETIRWVVESAR